MTRPVSEGGGGTTIDRKAMGLKDKLSFLIRPTFTKLFLILLITFAPVISVVIASAIAEYGNCTLNEAGYHPCIVFGKDYGHAILTLALLGWLAIATIPIGGAAVIVWLIWFAIYRWQLKRPGRVESTV